LKIVRGIKHISPDSQVLFDIDAVSWKEYEMTLRQYDADQDKVTRIDPQSTPKALHDLLDRFNKNLSTGVTCFTKRNQELVADHAQILNRLPEIMAALDKLGELESFFQSAHVDPAVERDRLRAIIDTARMQTGEIVHTNDDDCRGCGC